MTDRIRFAVRLPHSWCATSRSGIIGVARLADELGMDVSVQDHLLAGSGVSPCGPSHAGEDRAVLEAHSTLSFVAAITERARLIAGVYVVPYRNPVWLAKEVASLDVLSEGRVVMGVGIGALRSRGEDGGQSLSAHGSIAARELDALGVRGHRGRMMDECIGVLDALWTQERASWRGELVSFEDLDLFPKPVQHPRVPIWVGGRSDAAVARAARIGDGWFPSQASVAVVAAGRRALDRMATEAGRATPSVAVNLFLSVDPDGDRARTTLSASMGHRFRSAEALFDSAIAGSPREAGERIQAYVDAGVTTFDLKYLPLASDDTMSRMRLMASEVLPAIKEPRSG